MLMTTVLLLFVLVLIGCVFSVILFSTNTSKKPRYMKYSYQLVKELEEERESLAVRRSVQSKRMANQKNSVGGNERGAVCAHPKIPVIFQEEFEMYQDDSRFERPSYRTGDRSAYEDFTEDYYRSSRTAVSPSSHSWGSDSDYSYSPSSSSSSSSSSDSSSGSGSFD